jgi:DNA-binding NtrC family response regulator
MKNDVNDLKQLVNDLMLKGADKVKVDDKYTRLINNTDINDTNISLIEEGNQDREQSSYIIPSDKNNLSSIQDTEEFVDESLSLIDKEKELIIKALEKHRGKRKYAAVDLGISERTLYRKIKEYDIDL